MQQGQGKAHVHGEKPINMNKNNKINLSFHNANTRALENDQEQTEVTVACTSLAYPLFANISHFLSSPRK